MIRLKKYLGNPINDNYINKKIINPENPSNPVNPDSDKRRVI